MTCAECGKEATFWLCSNACALAYAKKRGQRRCAICSYDAKTKRIGRHDTTKLCAECQSHMENQDWIHRACEEPDGEVEQQNAALGRLREQQDRPLPKITATLTRIARLITEGERVIVEYRDSSGRLRGKRERWRALSTRAIARRVGCSQAMVLRLIRHIEN